MSTVPSVPYVLFGFIDAEKYENVSSLVPSWVRWRYFVRSLLPDGGIEAAAAAVGIKGRQSRVRCARTYPIAS